MLSLVDGRQGFSRRSFLRVGSLALSNLHATIMHTLLDVSQLRVTQGMPREVLSVATSAPSIPGLL